MWIGEDRGERSERGKRRRWERDGPSIRGFGIASDDGIFQNVKTNIAKPRLPTGMGHLDYDSQTTPHPRFVLDILPSSRAISKLSSFFTLSYPLLHRWPSPSLSAILFPFYICRLCVYVYGDVIYTEKVYRVAH